MSEQKIALSLKNIQKSFGQKKIHQGVSFDLLQGEVLGLFGGSGTGKSVILRSIVGLENPDDGEIVFHNTDITKLSEKELIPIRLQIAYVFQNGALFDSLTVEENLAYPLRAHTQKEDSEIKQEVNQMLSKVDLSGANHLLPAELSGGMQKRAGLARSIILKPKVILFDEPTAGLDPVNTKRLLKNMIQLKEDGITGIFVTHDIPAALEICDRIAILHKGKIHVIDTPKNLSESSDPVVRSFLHAEA